MDDAYEEMRSRMQEVLRFLVAGWEKANSVEQVLETLRGEELSPKRLMVYLNEREQIAADEKERAAVAFHKGLFYEARQDAPLALRFYERANQYNPAVTRYICAAGEVALKLGEVAKAEEIFTTGLLYVDEPGYLRVSNGLASSHYYNARYEDAEAEYEGIRMHPLFEAQDPELRAAVLNNLGWILAMKGSIEKAIDHLEEAILVKKTEAHNAASCSLTMCNLAHAYRMDGQSKKAKALLEEAERRLEDEYRSNYPEHPAFARVYNQSGVTAIDNKDFGAAARFFGRSVAIFVSQFPKCHEQKAISMHNRVLALMHSGDKDGAYAAAFEIKALLHDCDSMSTAIVDAVNTDLQELGLLPN